MDADPSYSPFFCLFVNTFSAKDDFKIKVCSSPLDFVWFIRSKINSMVSAGPNELKSLRNTHVVSNSLVSRRSSSLRVPERTISMRSEEHTSELQSRQQ